MTEKELLLLAISNFSFLKTTEKRKLFENVSILEELLKLELKDISIIVGRSLSTKDFDNNILKKKVDRSIRTIQNYSIRLVSIYDDEYPKELLKLSDAPFVLFYRGEKLQNEKKVAIVGTRKPTGNGWEFTTKIAREISQRGYTIVSGLAIGIDSCAHRAAVEVKGKTIAVLPCGVENIYPRLNASLAGRILNCGGTIISEYPPYTEALKFRFLKRNRIVSGLSKAVLVMEAPQKSGALSTAKHAMEQRLPVVTFKQMENSIQNEGGCSLESYVVESVDEVLNIIEDKKNQTEKIFYREGILHYE